MDKEVWVHSLHVKMKMDASRMFMPLVKQSWKKSQFETKHNFAELLYFYIYAILHSLAMHEKLMVRH